MAKNFRPMGKVRILIRTEIRILPVSTSAYPQIRTSAFYHRPFLIHKKMFLKNIEDTTAFGLVICCMHCKVNILPLSQFTTANYTSINLSEYHKCLILKTNKLYFSVCLLTTWEFEKLGFNAFGAKSLR